MANLDREQLYSLEQYSDMRPDFRQKVMEHKKHRRIFLGDNATLYFESFLTMQYQVQEMLRIEKIFDKEGIQEELDAYNPLIPDGKNWKATFMIEYPNEGDRKVALSKMIGIEDKVYVSVEDHDPVWAIADEDLERDTEEKTSSVHFMRFELNDDMIASLKSGAALNIGIEHPELTVMVTADDASRQSLIDDLD